MTLTQWLLVAWLAINGLVIVYRGGAKTTRTYTTTDAVCGAAEIAVAIWAVASL